MVVEKYAKRPKRGDEVETGRYGIVRVVGVHEHGKVLDVQTRAHGVERVERVDQGYWLVISHRAWAAWHQGYFSSVAAAMRAARDWHQDPDKPEAHATDRLWIVRGEGNGSRRWRLVNCTDRGPGRENWADGFFGPITAANVDTYVERNSR